jgi:hypothetical protein
MRGERFFWLAPEIAAQRLKTVLNEFVGPMVANGLILPGRTVGKMFG